MGTLIDLTGRRFGNLVVKNRGKTIFRERGGTILYWVCACDCGNVVEVVGGDLKSGRTLSCGCYGRKRAKECHTTHGLYHTRLRETWSGMKQRCYNPRKKHYDRYGGRGIKVCPEWQTFEPFYAWAMDNGYNDTLTLDRIDNDGNYCPENCRWVTTKEQSNNKSNNRTITYGSETHTVSEWAEKLGLSYSAMLSRVERGWAMDRIVNTPPRRRG